MPRAVSAKERGGRGEQCRMIAEGLILDSLARAPPAAVVIFAGVRLQRILGDLDRRAMRVSLPSGSTCSCRALSKAAPVYHSRIRQPQRFGSARVGSRARARLPPCRVSRGSRRPRRNEARPPRAPPPRRSSGGRQRSGRGCA